MRIIILLSIILFQSFFGGFVYSQTNDTILESNSLLDTLVIDTSIVLNDTIHIDTTTIVDSSHIYFDTLRVFKENWSNSNIFPYRTGAAPKVPDSLVIALVDTTHKFVLPVYGEISSPYGWRGRRMHKGIDIKLYRGDTVLACFDGKVRFAKYNHGGYGYLVIIRHFNGLESYYAHLTELKVEANEYVKAGQFIGTGGNTGAPRVGTHLHWELRWKDYTFDPLKIVDFENKKLSTDTLIVSDKIIKYKPSSKTGRAHIVKQGDTLSAIAVKYHTSIGYLCALNEIRRNGTLRIGQRIILP